jgi:CubicO group peptidase (beta-lactamase class C family)
MNEPKRRNGSLGRWTVGVIALLAVAALAWLTLSQYGQRYARFVFSSADRNDPALYEPAATLRGGNAPPPPPLSPADAGIDAAALELAATYANERNTSALIVGRRGHVVFERYFGATQATDRVDVAEWNQLLVVLAAGAALRDRHIALLDEPAANYLKDWVGGSHSSITVRHLLEQTSGLEPSDTGSMPWSAAVREQLSADRVEKFLQRPVAATPGRVFQPQPADLMLAAVLIERAAGAPYLDYLSQSIWQPIGAADAMVRLDREDGFPHVDCCLLSQPRDWLRVGELLVQDGIYQGTEIVPPGWVRQMSAVSAAAKTTGWVVRSDGDYAARDVFRVEAAGKQRIWFIPSLQVVIVRTGEEPDSAKGWDDATIPDLIARGSSGFAPRQAPKGSEVDPARYAPRH